MNAISALVLLFVASVAFAVDIQIPSEIRDPGSILLDGTPGVDQKDDYSICSLARDEQGRLKANGKDTCSNHKLGQDVHAKAGTYIVGYSGMSVLVDVKDVQVRLNLVPLQLKKIDGTFGFSLYRDFNDANQRQQAAVERFVGYNVYLQAETGACTDKEIILDSSARSLCDILTKSKRPEDFLPAMKFGEYGEAYSKKLVTDGKVVNDKWVYKAEYPQSASYTYRVGGGNDGDFLAVFPGVYFAVFWSATKHKFTQPNIVVK